MKISVKRGLLFILLSVVLAALFVMPASAWDNFTIPKTNTPPVIDGKLDDCYMKLHNFYDTAEFLENYDANHDGAGCTYLTYDDNFLYVYVEAYHGNYAPENSPYVSSNGSCMYLAILSGLPEAFNVDSQIQLAINLSADGTQEWKYTSSVPENAKDNSVDKLLYDKCPFNFMVVRDEAKKTTYYEIGLPWTQLDRTGTVKFTENHVFTFDYIVTLDPGIIVQYGQGLMNDIYDGGAYVKLGPAPVVVTEAPVTEASAAESGSTQSAQTFDAFAAIIFTASAAVFAASLSYKKRR